MGISSNEKEKKLQELEEVFQEVARNISVKIFQDADRVLTHPQFFMLKHLGSGPATVSEVAEQLGVSLSAITSMADRMVKMGYLIRTRSESDRRLVMLELTENGRKVLEESTRKRRKIVYNLLGRLPEDDLVALYDIYSKLLRLIKVDAD